MLEREGLVPPASASEVPAAAVDAVPEPAPAPPPWEAPAYEPWRSDADKLRDCEEALSATNATAAQAVRRLEARVGLYEAELERLGVNVTSLAGAEGAKL